MEEKEPVASRVGGVPLVELPDPLHRGGHDRRVAGADFRIAVGDVAQQGEEQVGRAVGEELRLEMLERLCDVVHLVKEQRHDDRGGVLRRELRRLAELEPRQELRRQRGKDE